MTVERSALQLSSRPMRRRLGQVVGALALAVMATVVAAPPSAFAQQTEDETGELDPNDTTPTTAPTGTAPAVPAATDVPLPLAPDEQDGAPADGPVDGVTTSSIPVETTLPPGCLPVAPPLAVFDGELVAHDSVTARFRVDTLVQGSLDGYQVEDLVDVDFYDDIRYLADGSDYRVAVEIDADRTDRLRSKAKPLPALFGGNQVVGVNDPGVVCPPQVDPIVSVLADGSSIETGVLAPLLSERRSIVWAFLRPALVLLAVLVGLVLIKRTSLLVVRLIRRARRHAAARREHPWFVTSRTR
jgi:hypothetical protein